ncbi:MAG: NAD(+) synthase, partial [Oscillospiraceae bacterium]
HIIAVTMQGFGTSGKTYQNAQTLMKQLGCDLREIPITDAVLQHFRDIGHDATLHDTTYENAQARQRTQILLDLSNKEGAIVVGTGDLSEAALGFCTFAGDHMANFNVNVCVTKTMMRQMIGYLCETEAFLFCSAVLLDILNTPISPELLPADEEGNIAQKTEQILGPYELHDFLLYYVVQYGCSGDELRFYARQAFPQISGEEIDRAAVLFLKRFVQNQFKRSCAPDCANITTVNLTALQFSFPSDSDVCAFLEKNETF